MAALSALAVAPSGVAAQGPPRLDARRTQAPPVIDGDVGEAEWANADTVESLIQFEPQRGAPATERTRVLVTYDSSAVYVAFQVWESGGITAQLTRRDANLLTDDSVILLLDTHRDRQSAYLFITNPLGTQSDGRIARDGRTVDYSWDESWLSASRRTAWGWEAEMAIPLSSVRYSSGEGRTWGINVGRSRRQNLELSFWAGPLENRFRISQAGELSGLDLPTPQRRAQVIAYGVSRVQEGEETAWDGGADLRYQLSSELAFDGTVNPDFATIEADQEQINLSRFELRLREKRPFFLEGSELFRQRIRTFYTRRISDIKGGGKVMGKQGPWTLAFLGAGTEEAGSVTGAFFGVGRVQRDLGRSSVGVTWAGREADGRSQGSVSVDATLFFTQTLGLTAQAVESYGQFGEGSTAFFIRPSFDSPTAHFHVRFTSLGARFADNANAVGFIRDDDRRELDSALEKTLWFETGFFERLSYESNYNIYWGQTGILRSWQIDESLETQLRNRWALKVAHSEEFKRFEKDFRNRDSGLTLGYNTRAFESVAVGYRFGRNFDSDFKLYTARARYKPTPESALEYELQRLKLDPDPDLETTWIHVVRANYFFTNDLLLRVFYQTNSAIDRNNLQAVFVYRYLPPFGTLQLAFQRGTAGFGERSDQGNTLFVKATAVF
ncbi:MAG: hypothetical protein BMS9Abin29_1383 [Gemmatimonadota bacterium]|nr:MAG: hypothetical protein BMS9Abin29_1383 [Gemmatimonadota bacterium]